MGADAMEQQSPVRIMTEKAVVACGAAVGVDGFDVPQRVRRAAGTSYHYDVVDATAAVHCGGVRYTPQQFHFHKTAEHVVDDRRYGMECHLVCTASPGAADGGAILVLAVLIGSTKSTASGSWRMQTVLGSGGTFDMPLGHLLPRRLDHFAYTGSLTTPPYTTGVRWCVFREPVQVLGAAVDKCCLRNTRPLQPLRDGGAEVSFHAMDDGAALK